MTEPTIRDLVASWDLPFRTERELARFARDHIPNHTELRRIFGPVRWEMEPDAAYQAARLTLLAAGYRA